MHTTCKQKVDRLHPRQTQKNPLKKTDLFNASSKISFLEEGKQIDIQEAENHFLKLFNVVMQGKEIIIAKAGKPAMKLMPVTSKKSKRKPGILKGKIKIADDFNAPLPEDILTAFEGK